jgi:hypothetical protein
MSHRLLGMTWLLGVAVLAGCGGEAPPADSADAGTVASSRPTSGTQSTAVSAVLLGTATVPVQLGFTMAERPEPGRPATITLTLTAAEDLERVEVRVSSAALSIAPEDATFVIAPLPASQPAEHPLKFTPTAAGLGDLEIQVSVTTAAGDRVARYAVPVLAEPQAPAAP